MGGFLREAIRSVAEQSQNSLELLVVDDGSDSRINIKPFAQNFSLHITWIYQKHAGKSAAINRALKRCRGRFVTILDADDLLPENSLSIRLRALKKMDADLCLGSFLVQYNKTVTSRRATDTLLNKTPAQIFRRLLLELKSSIHQNTMMFSRKLALRAGGMDERLKRGQDKDFALRLIREAGKMIILPEDVYIYRRYNRKITVRCKNRILGAYSMLYVIAKHSAGFHRIFLTFWTLLIQLGKLGYNMFTTYKK